tara:strand:- start:17 stop:358 length:342 start_codon:yes stop_codon:yes gene_type:complete
MQNYYYDIIPDEIRELIMEKVKIMYKRDLLVHTVAGYKIMMALISKLNDWSRKKLTQYLKDNELELTRNGVGTNLVKRQIVWKDITGIDTTAYDPMYYPLRLLSRGHGVCGKI